MPISRRKLIQRFNHFGFSGPFSGGRHQFMVKGDVKIRIPNPHKGSDISEALLNEILRQANIEKADWEAL
jgi:predicted RNA binding protein YcfA (HicA-like mRNA interferase family)